MALIAKLQIIASLQCCYYKGLALTFLGKAKEILQHTEGYLIISSHVEAMEMKQGL